MESNATPDALLHRSFLRHVAALAGTGQIDHRRLATALVEGTGIDKQLVDDLEVMTEQLIEDVTGRSDPADRTLLRGHLSIVEQLASVATPDTAAKLLHQAERSANALAHLDSAHL